MILKISRAGVCNLSTPVVGLQIFFQKSFIVPFLIIKDYSMQRLLICFVFLAEAHDQKCQINGQ